MDMKTCVQCNKSFKTHAVYANHVRWKHSPIPISVEGREALRAAAIRNNIKKWGEPIIKNCKRCNAPLPKGKRRNKFCDASACKFHAHSLSGSASWKNRPARLAGVKAAWSESFIQNQGHPKSKNFSSKGEEDLKRKLKERLSQFHWSSGGLYDIGKKMRKSFDLYCKEEKILIEYDGIHHWKNIYGNLQEVQMKDRQTEEFCRSNGWSMIRVNEKTYYIVPNIVEIIVGLIENRTQIEPVTKLYLIPEYTSIVGKEGPSTPSFENT